MCAFFVNGLITIKFCWLYRQPLAFFWTIPGTVLVGPALARLSFAEVVGAYVATGLLVLGWSLGLGTADHGGDGVAGTAGRLSRRSTGVDRRQSSDAAGCIVEGSSSA